MLRWRSAARVRPPASSVGKTLGDFSALKLLGQNLGSKLKKTSHFFVGRFGHFIGSDFMKRPFIRSLQSRNERPILGGTASARTAVPFAVCDPRVLSSKSSRSSAA